MNTDGQCTAKVATYAKNFIGLKLLMFSPANLTISTVDHLDATVTTCMNP